MSMFSPRFKSVAAMAGWDEEALMLATLIVEDTPERNAKNRKRSNVNCKSPPPATSSRSKRRARRRSPVLGSITVFNLDDDDESASNNDTGNGKRDVCATSDMPQKVETDRAKAVEGKENKAECSKNDSLQKDEIDKGKANAATSVVSSSTATFPCVDRLREELSCAICLDICFEPSTTPCGHSFCKKCLKNAADKCGKRCPKCRQLISNGRSCTINTVLWNTIQLLFPVEVEARKATEAQKSSETECRNPETTKQTDNNLRATRRLRPVGYRREGGSSGSRERVVTTQDEDAALALRLQREEFMTIYRGSSLARDNLRSMAQRAINLRVRHRAV